MMERDAFERSLRASVRRTPFPPFIIELVSGTPIRVDHPEALVSRASTASYFDKEGIPTLFCHDGVARMTGTVNVSPSS